MRPSDSFYRFIPFHIREQLCELLSIDTTSEKVKNLIISNFVEKDLDSRTKIYPNYIALAEQLIEEYKETKIERKVSEFQKSSKNYEQSRKKAMGLKSEQIIKMKEFTFCSGLSFFFALEILASQESYKITIPESIMIGYGKEDPILLYTDKNGILKSSTVPFDHLQKEIERIHNLSVNGNYPASVLKYESYNSEGIKIKSEVVLFNFFESHEVFWKIHTLSYSNNLIVLQEYIKSKTGLPSKIRVDFTNKIEKVYRVHHRKLIKIRKNDDFHNKLENSLAETPKKLNLYNNFENMIKAVELCEFFIEMGDCLSEGQLDDIAEFIGYLERRKPKLLKKLEASGNSLIRYPTSSIIDEQEKLKLYNHFTAKLSNTTTEVYNVTNLTSLEPISMVFKEIIKSSKIFMMKTQKIVDIVADFTENEKGNYFLIKAQRILIEEKNAGLLPKWKQFKHISLFRATEGSSVTKGKKQQLCCGDYCNFLTRNDMKTSEKIELFIKAMPEYSSVLYKLLKIQNFLNLDSAQSLFNGGNTSGTPLTQNMQYKTIRRIILEDRNDPNSLRNTISGLPDDILRELAIAQFKYSDFHANNLHSINKKLSWEYELVPVCDMCYNIYNLKDTEIKAPVSVTKSQSEKKLWKINEYRYKVKPILKFPKYFVDYDKMLKNCSSSNNDLSLIKEIVKKSQNVAYKKQLDSHSITIPNTPKIKEFYFSNKISSVVLNGVCERLDRFQNAAKKRLKPIDSLKPRPSRLSFQII